MKTLAFLAMCAFAAPVFAGQKMVFLVEDSHGKHVGQSLDFKNYKSLTSGNLWHLYPAVSSDGQSLVYVRGEDKSFELVVERAGKTEVYGGKGFQLHPRFAKNDRVVFASKDVDGTNKIVKIDLEKSRALGELAEQVVSESEGFFPAPFASGEKIVYQRNTKVQGKTVKEIVLLNLVDNKSEVLDQGMSPALSKDERFAAYTKSVNGNWDVYVQNLSTKEIFRATEDENFDFSPSFDRFGNLLYTSDRLENGVFSIFRQGRDSWSKGQLKEEVLISKKGTSFYAPRASGETTFKIGEKASMPGEPRSSFGAIEHKGKVYVAGGHQGAEHTYPPESFTARVEYYDLEKKEWFNTAPRLHKAHGFQLAAHGNYIYAFGGFAYEESTNPKWKSLDVVERYDIRTKEWEIVGHMPRRRSSNVVVKVGSKAYLIGGWDSTPKYDGDLDGTFHGEIDVFDFETQTFSTLEKRLPKKRRAFSAFEKDGIIYLAGGISEGASHFNLLDDFTAFDPVLKTFSEMPCLPFATFAPAAGALKDSAFVFGGMLKLGEWSYEYISHVYEFDFGTNTWGHTGRYLKEEKGFSQVVELNNSLGVLGGHSYQNNTDSPVKTFEVFGKK